MKLTFPLLAILAVILTGACGTKATATPVQDAGAIQTQAMQVAATQFFMQQTQTAVVNAPTVQPTATIPPIISSPTFIVSGTPGTVAFTPFSTTPLSTTPFATIIPTLPAGGSGTTANGCNDSQFVSETIPDKTAMSPGKEFTKVWEMLNTGTCSWETGYVFTFLPDVSTAGFIGHDVAYKASDTPTLPQHSQSFVLKLKAPDTAGEYFGYWKMKDASGNFFGARVYVDIVVQ